jgi:Spy/CpxP family protein refolding chaperone
MRVISLLNLFLLSLNLAAFGTIVYRNRVSEPRPDGTGAVGDDLGLTPEQSEAIGHHRASFVEEWKQIGSEIEDVREELLDAVRREATEPGAVERRVEEMSQLQARLERQAVEQLVRESELMTPQQRDRYFTQVQGRMLRGCGYRGRWSREAGSGDGVSTGRGKGGRGRGRRGRR